MCIAIHSTYRHDQAQAAPVVVVPEPPRADEERRPTATPTPAEVPSHA
jgi:hypothetical protein